MFTLALSALIQAATAQICTPDTSLKVSGIIPAQNPAGFVGVPYESVLHFRLPKDTQVTFLGQQVTATIDSMEILKVEGLPAEFSFACGNTGCIYYPEVTGCAKLSGTPAPTSVGSNPLLIYLRVYGRVGPIATFQDDTVRRYNLDISGGSNVDEVANEKPLLYPNPVKDFLHVNLPPRIAVAELAVMDIYGKIMLLQSVKNAEYIDLSHVPSGIYFISLLSKTEQTLKWKIMKL